MQIETTGCATYKKIRSCNERIKKVPVVNKC